MARLATVVRYALLVTIAAAFVIVAIANLDSAIRYQDIESAMDAMTATAGLLMTLLAAFLFYLLDEVED